MTERATIGDIVRERRKQLGWSQTDLAERVGVSQRTISRVEHNLFVDALRSDLLRRFADELGLKYDDLAVAAGLFDTRNAARAVYALNRMDGHDRERLIEIHGWIDPLLLQMTPGQIDVVRKVAELLLEGTTDASGASEQPTG